MLVHIWEFRIRPAMRQEFERHYGPHGTWVEFFRQDAAYLGTELLRDARDATLYLTLDRWENAAAFETFKSAHRARYLEIDRACKVLTTSERLLGSYEQL